MRKKIRVFVRDLRPGDMLKKFGYLEYILSVEDTGETATITYSQGVPSKHDNGPYLRKITKLNLPSDIKISIVREDTVDVAS